MGMGGEGRAEWKCGLTFHSHLKRPPTEAALSSFGIGPISRSLYDSHLPDTPPASGALLRWRESGPNVQYGGAEGSDRCYDGLESFSMRATAARTLPQIRPLPKSN